MDSLGRHDWTDVKTSFYTDWSFDRKTLLDDGAKAQKLKHRAYHSWQLAFQNPADFICEIRQISPEIHTKNLPDFMKSIRNPADFTWNPYEIHQISWMWAFAWWSSIGLSFERPIRRDVCISTWNGWNAQNDWLQLKSVNIFGTGDWRPSSKTYEMFPISRITKDPYWEW